MRDFEEWLSHFRRSISGYDYYVNFGKVVENVEKIRKTGAYGAIVGKAYYVGAIDLKKAFEVANDN